MRSEWTSDKIIEHLLAALMPANKLICEVSLRTGLRIGDVLQMRPAMVAPDKHGFTIKEEKTGKSRRVFLPDSLRDEIFAQSGRFWCFEHRLDRAKHRTRQAVFKDLRRAAVLFRCTAHVSPHSLRKIKAVHFYHKTHSLTKVRDLLNHSNESVTMLYALADEIHTRKRTGLDSHNIQ